MLHRRPPQGRFREQLFWLVDVIFACKSSGDDALMHHAALVEDALGRLGEYIETADTQALGEASARIEEFAEAVRQRVKSYAETPVGAEDIDGKEGQS